MCIRENYLRNIAGDSVTVTKTAAYLRGRGVSADINHGNRVNYSDYDVIHLFNLTRISETYEYFKRAVQSKKPVVITPVYWDLSRYWAYTGSMQEIRLWEDYACFRKEILAGCDMIYPSSVLEMELLKGQYGRTLPCTVVYNGIDTKDPWLTGGGRKEHAGDAYILCAARICPRKNQLALARAADALKVKLVLAGQASNRVYLEKCLQFPGTVYKDFVQAGELAALYANAALHVLCGFVETPGLSSLEAGASGCNIVSTAQGSTTEYFEDMAVYCDPYDEADILSAVQAGLSANRQPGLQNRILEKFTLESCLDALYRSYLKLAKAEN